MKDINNKELNAIKKDVETLNNKLNELTEEELAQVSGGKHVVNNLCEPEAPEDPKSSGLGGSLVPPF